MNAKFLLNHVDSATFKKLCKEWIVSVRKNEQYRERRDVEMAIIEFAPTLNLEIDEVMQSLLEFANSNESME
jgi:hypothetical protein